MRVVLNDTTVIVLADQKSRVGYHVDEDADGFFNPSPGFEVFMEYPQVGAHPWVAYVRRDGDDESTTRLPLNKSRITRVSR